MNKIEAREKFLKIRKNIVNREEKDEVIFNKIIENKKFKKAKVIAVYKSIKGEFNTDKLVKYCLENGKTVCYPKVIDDEIMLFYKVNSIDDVNTIGKYHDIYEPSGKEEDLIVKEDIELMIVPLICFDDRYYRVGYGKGYYDRYLYGNEDIFKVGLTYQELKVDEFLETDDFDVILDLVITD